MLINIDREAAAFWQCQEAAVGPQMYGLATSSDSGERSASRIDCERVDESVSRKGSESIPAHCDRAARTSPTNIIL